MARARAQARMGRVAFKVLFGHDGRPFAVETDKITHVANAQPLAKVKPTVQSIEIPLEVIQGRHNNRAVCWTHIRCRLIPVPCRLFALKRR